MVFEVLINVLIFGAGPEPGADISTRVTLSIDRTSGALGGTRLPNA